MQGEDSSQGVQQLEVGARYETCSVGNGVKGPRDAPRKNGSNRPDRVPTG